MATGKQIRINIISALNAAGIEATSQQVDAMSRSVQKSMKDAASSNRRHWADIKAAWDMGTGAIRRAWSAIRTVLSSSFKFETQTNQFKTLVGNIDEARAHMADLKALGDTPPFSLDEFVKASRSLMVMTDGALGYKKSLELIGDAAAATGHPIEEMGQAVGRLYAFIRDGQPLSRAVAQLRNMGVITPEVAQKLQDLQAAGKSNAEIWAEVEAQLGRYKGAMAETEQTGNGLMSAIKSRWDNIVRAFGTAFEDTAKGGMSEMLSAMDELEKSGAVEEWAESAIGAFQRVKEGALAVCSPILTAFGYVWKTLKGLYESTAQSIGNAVGTISNGGGVVDALKSGASGFKQGWIDAFDADGAEAEQRESRREKSRKKRAERAAREEAESGRRAAEEERRIKESLAEGQKKKEERDAKAAAEKKAEEEKKAAEKAAKERERLDAQEAARRERERQKELADRIKDHQRLLAAERAEESKAHSSVSAAESKLQQAWSWYRDKDSMAAQLQEEKANAEAEKQYEKDFEKLRWKHRDWRKAENLSVDEEAVRRVAIAREEKEAAEKHLAEIEKNTAELAAKLDELLQVK